MGRIVARVDEPVEIVKRHDERTMEPPRHHVKWCVEDIEGLLAEKRA
jgi:hypothetical protein